MSFHDGALHVERKKQGFTVTSLSGQFEAEKIVFALPAYNLVPIFQSIDPTLAQIFSRVEYPPVAVAYLGYRRDQFPVPPEGFGGLIPSSEKRNILGIIFSSSNFQDRAPDGNVLLTVLMGGARQSEVAKRSQKEILKIASEEVAVLLQPHGEPTFQQTRVWDRAIPQYNVGYGDVLEALDRAETANPGLYFIGNYRNGISMGACIRNATELAKLLV